MILFAFHVNSGMQDYYSRLEGRKPMPRESRKALRGGAGAWLGARTCRLRWGSPGPRREGSVRGGRASHHTCQRLPASAHPLARLTYNMLRARVWAPADLVGQPDLMTSQWHEK